MFFTQNYLLPAHDFTHVLAALYPPAFYPVKVQHQPHTSRSNFNFSDFLRNFLRREVKVNVGVGDGVNGEGF
jgi:hypothetical protein